MGFCGCSLHDSTTSAAIYGIAFSIFGISWTSVAINKLQDSLEMNYSYGSLFSLENLNYLKSNKVIFGLVASSLGLHVLWFLSSFLLIIGNVKKIPGYLYFWISVTLVALISDIGSSIYCITRAFNVMDFPSGATDFYTASPLTAPFFGYLLIGALFNKLGLISIGIQIALMIFVNGRAKEIIQKQKTPDVTIIPHPAGGHMQQMQPYPMHFQPLQPSNMQQYSPNLQPSQSPNMQQYSPNLQPSQSSNMQQYSPNFQPSQSPNMQPFQHRLTEDWNQSAPQYTNDASTRTKQYPYERDHICESRTYLQNRPANPNRYHSQEELLRDDQFPLPRPGTKYYEPEPDYKYYGGRRY